VSGTGLGGYLGESSQSSDRFILFSDNINSLDKQGYMFLDDKGEGDGASSMLMHFRHFKKANAAFADGHVGSIGSADAVSTDVALDRLSFQ
jgi:prepilin-type processing-associated H-X9-DG protein